MKRVLLAVIIGLALAAMSPAPIKDQRTNVPLEPEKSQAVRNAEAQAKRMGELGGVPDREGAPEAPAIVPDYNAAAATVGATKRMDAKATVKKASAQIEKPRNNPLQFVWAGLILVAVFGLFQVFKTWANKNLPDRPGM